MCVVFVDGLVGGFDALRVWNESGEAGVQVVSWASPKAVDRELQDRAMHMGTL